MLNSRDGGADRLGPDEGLADSSCGLEHSIGVVSQLRDVAEDARVERTAFELGEPTLDRVEPRV